jgi:hypothetical protein
VKNEHINEILNAKRCNLWPDCACARLWQHWDEKLSEETDWTFPHLSAADQSIFLMLSCASRHSPNRRVRASATAQLLNPFWNRHPYGAELTQEDCKRIRNRG